LITVTKIFTVVTRTNHSATDCNDPDQPRRKTWRQNACEHDPQLIRQWWHQSASRSRRHKIRKAH